MLKDVREKEKETVNAALETQTRLTIVLLFFPCASSLDLHDSSPEEHRPPSEPVDEQDSRDGHPDVDDRGRDGDLV